MKQKSFLAANSSSLGWQQGLEDKFCPPSLSPCNPVISLEASPDLVPIPSGQCHLSRVLPAILWRHQSTTTVIKTVILVWGNKRDFFFLSSGRKYCKTPSRPHRVNHTDVSLPVAHCVCVWTEWHQSTTGVLVPLLRCVCITPHWMMRIKPKNDPNTPPVHTPTQRLVSSPSPLVFNVLFAT